VQGFVPGPMNVSKKCCNSIAKLKSILRHSNLGLCTVRLIGMAVPPTAGDRYRIAIHHLSSHVSEEPMGMNRYGYGCSTGYGSRQKTPSSPHSQLPFRLLPGHDFSSALPHMNIEKSFSSVNCIDRQCYIRSKRGHQMMVLKLNDGGWN